MRVFLGILGGLGLLFGLFAMVTSRSAVGEIEALIGILIGTVGLGTMAVTDAIMGGRAEAQKRPIAIGGATSAPAAIDPLDEAIALGIAEARK